jgi:predicted glutamine amidotransferase
MCKLITIIKQGSKNRTLNALIEMQFNALQQEPHGAGCLLIDKHGNVKVKRSFNYSHVFNYFLRHLDRAVIASIHTRLATMGSITHENIHFFRHRNKFMAHNGIVGQFASTYYEYPSPYLWYSPSLEDQETDVKSDSRHFLESLPDDADNKTITQAVKDKKLSGFGFIYDTTRKTAHVLIQKKVALIHEKRFACFFSFSPTLTRIHHSINAVLGIPYTTPTAVKRFKRKPMKVIEGIYEIRLSDVIHAYHSK